MLVKCYIQTNNVSKTLYTNKQCWYNVIYKQTMLVKRYIQTNNVCKTLYTNNVSKTLYTNHNYTSNTHVFCLLYLSSSMQTV